MSELKDNKRSLRTYTPTKKDIALPNLNQQKAIFFAREYVPWYANSRNLFPNQIMQHYLKASIFSPILQELVDYFTGYGFESENKKFNEFQKNVSGGTSLRKCFKALQFARTLSGNAFLMVRWIPGNSEFLELKSLDFMNARLSKDREFVLFDPDAWQESTFKMGNDEKIKRLALYPNFIVKDGYYTSCIHIKDDVPGFADYSPPYWIHGLYNSEVPYKITDWNRNRIKRGFAPDAFYNAEVDDDKAAQEAIDRINDSFTGENESGGVVMVSGDGVFTILDKSFEMDWTKFSERSEIDIHTDLRFPMSLTGRYTGGYSKDRAQADYNLFMPFMKETQMLVWEEMEKPIKEILGIDTEEIQIKNLNPFEEKKTRGQKHAENFDYYTEEQKAEAAQIMFEEANLI